ncbi:MAG: M1 family metallopeptidase, partial [Bacteroidia bacterium]|nr:M1 family metallopeptidase [Bacteroidia bacterium]
MNILRFIVISYCFFLSTSLVSQKDSLSPRIANYHIEVVLDTADKTLNAQQKIIWHNRTADTITKLYFHLYYNAFKNSESTFFKERGIPEFLTQGIDEDCGWSWTQIRHIKDQEGNDLSDSWSYESTDDNNESDETVFKLELEQFVLPGQSIELDIAWHAKIPKTMIRTGYNKDFYFFAQWFPKLGVYEPEGMRYAKQGQWNCHQYHSSGEYYADFGVYNVSVTVPSDYVVAASGMQISEEINENNKTVKFLAEDVIDFTWTCSPHFEEYTDHYKDIEIKFYCYPYKSHLAERYLPTIKFGMKFLEEHLGPYPYKRLSIIDPPIHGMFTGGMEYPTLITSLSFCFFPEGFRTPETLVIHEYIHQYFMQMVATHEVEDPWMDEGITSYYEGRILDELFTPQNSTIDFLGVKAGNKAYNRAEFLMSGNTKLASNAVKSWEYKHGGYGVIAYNKAAMWLQTMEGLVGQPLMD